MAFQASPMTLGPSFAKRPPFGAVKRNRFRLFYAITRHADIVDISSRPGVFSNSKGAVILNREQAAELEKGTNPFGEMRSIIDMDPPEHREFRKVASGFFTPRSIHRLDDIVTECAREQVDKLGDEGECDFVEAIAQRHPLRVLSRILGIDREDEELVLKLTQQLFASEDPDLQREGEDRMKVIMALGAEFMGLFSRIIEDRRANPRDDLASLLANAKMVDGSAMPPIETFGYFLIVFTAGHDTTRNAIAGGMAALLENPSQLKLLCDNPGLTKTAVEEVVRWTTPVNYMRRVLLEDVVVQGVELKEGDDLALFYASANRDDEVFDRPFEFDITRQPNRHLGFGTGEHFCLGSHVARLSARALFLELATRIESVEPAAPASQIESSFVVGYKTLPIKYKIRPAA